MRQLFTWIWALGFLAMVASLGGILYGNWQRDAQALSTFLQGSNLRGELIEKQVEGIVSDVQALRRTAERSSTDSPDSSALSDCVKNFPAQPETWAWGIALENGLYAFMMRDAKGGVSLSKIPYDYWDPTLPEAQWYTAARDSSEPYWSGPFFGKASQVNLMVRVQPLRNIKGVYIGAAFAILPVSVLHKIMADSISAQNYRILTNSYGSIIYHPRVELVEKNLSIQAIAHRTSSPDLQQLSDSLSHKSVTGHLPYRSIYTGELNQLDYFRIGDQGWYVISISEVKTGQFFCNFHRILLLSLTAAILLGIGLFALLFPSSPWVIALGTSALFSFGLIIICYLAIQRYEDGVCIPPSGLFLTQAADSTYCIRSPLANPFAATAFLDHCLPGHQSTLSLPTGIQIQTIDLVNAYSFTASGYVWQKYPERGDTAWLGIEFPESQITDWTHISDDSLAPNAFLRTWRFRAEIRQPFSYRLYPLDKEELWLRMRPGNLSRNILLEPDFSSYQPRENAILGLDGNLTLPQWTLIGSNFSYALHSEVTSYGKERASHNMNTPELYFSVHIRRNMLDAFISQFIPLFVILLMVFSILWVGRKSDPLGLMGFDSLSGASGCSALFFIVIYNHISIRNQLGAPVVVYMEVFFFVTYAAILYVSLNSILVAMDNSSRFINFKDNFLSRILYWPILTGGLYLCTLAAFYYL